MLLKLKIINKLRIIAVIISILVFNGFSITLLKAQTKSLENKKKKNYIYSIQDRKSDSLNWTAIDTFIKDKKYVFIGEHSHGVCEYNTTQISLINYLQQKYGFNIVVLECNQGLCLYFDYFRNTIPDSIKQKYTCLFNYKEKQLIALNLNKKGFHVSGMDITQNNTICSLFNEYIRKSLTNIPESLLIEDSLFSANKDYKSHEKAIALSNKWNNALKNIKFEKTDSLYNKRLERDLQLRNFWISKYPKITTELRDSLMKENVLWLIKNIYINQKIIVLAHNEHIAKSNIFYKNKTLGAMLPDSIKSQTYVFGLVAYQGSYRNPALNQVLKIEKNKKKSLGANMNYNKFEISFCDFSKQTKSNDNLWMYKSIKTSEKNFNIIPSESYDGIIQIKNVTPVNKIYN